MFFTSCELISKSSSVEETSERVVPLGFISFHALKKVIPPKRSLLNADDNIA